MLTVNMYKQDKYNTILNLWNKTWLILSGRTLCGVLRYPGMSFFPSLTPFLTHIKKLEGVWTDLLIITCEAGLHVSRLGSLTLLDYSVAVWDYPHIDPYSERHAVLVQTHSLLKECIDDRLVHLWCCIHLTYERLDLLSSKPRHYSSGSHNTLIIFIHLLYKNT